MVCCAPGFRFAGRPVTFTAGAVGSATVTLKLLVAVAPVLSRTVTVIVDVPGVEGVPEKAPLEERLTPAGSPLAVHVNGGTPPVALSEPVNGVPRVGVGIVPVVIDRGGDAIVRVNERLAVARTESVTVAVTLNVPASVGVPLKAPFGEAVTPGGSPAAENVYGCVPPAAPRVAE